MDYHKIQIPLMMKITFKGNFLEKEILNYRKNSKKSRLTKKSTRLNYAKTFHKLVHVDIAKNASSPMDWTN